MCRISHNHRLYGEEYIERSINNKDNLGTNYQVQLSPKSPLSVPKQDRKSTWSAIVLWSYGHTDIQSREIFTGDALHNQQLLKMLGYDPFNYESSSERVYKAPGWRTYVHWPPPHPSLVSPHTLPLIMLGDKSQQQPVWWAGIVIGSLNYPADFTL